MHSASRSPALHRFLDAPGAKLGLGVTGAIAFLAAGFMTWRREHDRCADIEAQIARQGRLEIDFVPKTRQYEEVSTQAYPVRRTLSVGVRNVGMARLTNCKLVMAVIEPNEGNLMPEVPMPLRTADLNPADVDFRRIVTFGEAGSTTAPDTVAAFHVLTQSDDPKSGERALSAEQVYVVMLRATAADCPACTRRFRISFPSGRLLMEALPG